MFAISRSELSSQNAGQFKFNLAPEVWGVFLVSTRLLISLACFVVAGVGNYLLLNRATATTWVLALSQEVSPDVPLSESHFRRVEVRGDRELFQDVVPYELRAGLYGKRVRRTVESGRLLLKADVEYDPAKIHADRIPPGFVSFTVRVKRNALISNPVTGDVVYLYPRPSTSSDKGPLKRYGPFRYLGWTSEQTEKTRTENIWLVVAVPTIQQDRQIMELEEHRLADRPEWLSHVEIANEPNRK
jgi:hypothetical protein